MFERNRIDTAERGMVSVEIQLTDGTALTGKVAMLAGRNFQDFLNGGGSFIEFESFEGETMYLAKASLKAVRPLSVPRAGGLSQRIRDLDGFDPYSVLGIERSVGWDDVKSAFHTLAKTYHPDRYATTDLPEEVRGYLATMARRVNAAYSALEAAQTQKRKVMSMRSEPVFSTGPRA